MNWLVSDFEQVRLRFVLAPRSEAPRDADEIVTAFRDGQVTLRSERRVDGFTQALQEIGYQRVHRGDLVVHAMDAFAGAIGVSEATGKCSPVCQVLMPSPQIDARFVAYILREAARSGFIQSLARGIRERSTDFRWAMAKDVRIPLPPPGLQHEIANFLDRECARIDELAGALGAALALSREWMTSRTQELLGVGPAGRMPFGRYATLHRGFDLPTQDRVDGPVKVIGSGGLTGHNDQAAVSGPAVVTGRYGSIGVVTWTDEACWPLNTTLFVSDFKGNNPRFVYWALRALPLTQEATKAAIPGLHRGDVHRICLGAFGQDQQLEIIDALDRRDRESSALASELRSQQALLGEYRNAFITEAVTGQLDVSKVSDAQMDESARAAMAGERPEVLLAWR